MKTTGGSRLFEKRTRNFKTFKLLPGNRFHGNMDKVFHYKLGKMVEIDSNVRMVRHNENIRKFDEFQFHR
jgi:hypothetical protein